MLRFLVVEDNQKHLNDARAYSQKLADCTVDFATTLAEAMDLLAKNRYDGAICDVFFPAEAGASAETFENALALSTKLVELGIHHVFNTAGNHHGSKYDGFLHKTPKAVYFPGKKRWETPSFLMSGMVIESYPDDSDTDKDTKQWQAAFRYLMLVLALVALPDKGENVVKMLTQEYPCDVFRSGFTYGDYGELTALFERITNSFVVEVFHRFSA